MNDLILILLIFLAVFASFLFYYIFYIVYHFFKRIIEGFRDKNDYKLYLDFKKTFSKQMNISKEEKKSILNQLKNQLIF